MTHGSTTRPRPPLKSGDEYDALTGWRRVLKGMQRSRVAARIKRAYRRRERQIAKRESDE